jgi:hypothetical protein
MTGDKLFLVILWLPPLLERIDHHKGGLRKWTAGQANHMQGLVLVFDSNSKGQHFGLVMATSATG